eukprot:TRINITY_DN22138_c0_g1_i1.p2 TRINITY_DN22138_c0_g1~~TRINITY_DN22138_c0_g1_i1.p2  ORF type:complete len:596 (+),score=83.60 TRINITY_DN22138_c0_g1_i1:76-1788(+)
MLQGRSARVPAGGSWPDQPPSGGPGPASYDAHRPMAASAGFDKGPSRPPFGSSTPRDFECGDIVTPAPGSYTALWQPDRPPPKPGGAKAAFASKAPRFAPAPAAPGGDTTGPGSYISPPVWAQHKPRLPGGRGQGRVSWQKVATAPSIPTQGQNNGYEEGPGGELVQQRGEDRYTGRRILPTDRFDARQDDCVGPGEYDPELPGGRAGGYLAPLPSAPQRGACDPPREQEGAPGPGQYEVASPTAEADRRRAEAAALQGCPAPQQTTAAFRSQMRRQPWAYTTSAVTPGPGTYQAAEAAQNLMQPQPPRQCISKIRRPPSSEPGRGPLPRRPVQMRKAEEAAPGPGAYDPMVDGFGPARCPADAAVPPLPRACHKGCAAGHQPRSLRFGSSATAAPGPGEYKPPVELVDGVRRKIHGRYGAFGSTAQRFPIKRAERDRGPGAYDCPVKLDPSNLRRRDQRTAVFASRSAQHDGFRVEQGPSCADYQAVQPWGGAITGPISIPRSPRFDASPPPLEPRAPPRLADGGCAPARPGGQSIPKAARFATRPPDSPGPGEYTPPRPLLKQSYNVS